MGEPEIVQRARETLKEGGRTLDAYSVRIGEHAQDVIAVYSLGIEAGRLSTRTEDGRLREALEKARKHFEYISDDGYSISKMMADKVCVQAIQFIDAALSPTAEQGDE